MPNVAVKCPVCGTIKILRNVGKDAFVCNVCRVSYPIEDNVVHRNVSLRRKKPDVDEEQTKIDHDSEVKIEWGE